MREEVCVYSTESGGPTRVHIYGTHDARERTVRPADATPLGDGRRHAAGSPRSFLLRAAWVGVQGRRRASCTLIEVRSRPNSTGSWEHAVHRGLSDSGSSLVDCGVLLRARDSPFTMVLSDLVRWRRPHVRCTASDRAVVVTSRRAGKLFYWHHLRRER